MAYDLSYLRNRILTDKLDDASFDPSVVDNFINDAQRDVFNTYELPPMEKVFTGLLPASGFIFEFPDDYQVTLALKITDPSGSVRDITRNYLPFRTFNAQFPVPSDNSSGAPSMWTIFAGQLYLSRPTDQNYTLQLFYLKSPVTLEDDGDIPEIPEAFQEVLISGAYYRCLERNEDNDIAAFVKNGEYADAVDKMLNRLGQKQIGSPTIMAQPMRAGRAMRRRRV